MMKTTTTTTTTTTSEATTYKPEMAHDSKPQTEITTESPPVHLAQRPEDKILLSKSSVIHELKTITAN